MTRKPASHSAADLLAFLIEIERLYRAQPDDTERRRTATFALGGLIQRAEELTGISEAGGLRVFRDTLDFFDDLNRGRDHPWLSLGPFGGFQKYTKAEERTRVHLLIGLEILIDAAGGKVGSKKAAFEKMQKALGEAGHAMSVGRVKTIYHEYHRGEFPHPELVRQFVDRFWFGNTNADNVARCEHGDPVHSCSLSKGARCSEIVSAAHTHIDGLFIPPN